MYLGLNWQKTVKNDTFDIQIMEFVLFPQMQKKHKTVWEKSYIGGKEGSTNFQMQTKNREKKEKNLKTIYMICSSSEEIDN